MAHATPSPDHDRWHLARLALAFLGVATGGLLALLDIEQAARWVWGLTTASVLIPTVITIVRRLLARDLGVDLIAALAMGGALALDEYLAAAIIALMLTTGEALERYAAGRARRELTALLARAPRTAHRRLGAQLEEVDVAQVVAGDVLVVKPGEVVPADGVLASDGATLDDAALTGESRPVSLLRGDRIRSGVTNAGAPLELRVTASAAESTYAGIVRMVSEAAASKAPFVRLADRYAVGFLAVTLVLAGTAGMLAGDPVRALAVLVVATPCPLILAAPAAIAAGMSRAARHGILVKGGASLEAVAGVTAVLLDKTGTVTVSRPRVVAVETFGELSADALVGLAASADQLTTHPFAPALLAEARDRGQEVRFPESTEEAPGSGVAAVVGGRRVAVGQLHWVAANRDAWLGAGRATAAPQNTAASGGEASRPVPLDWPAVRSVETRTAVEGSSAVYVSVDGQLAGALILADPIRPEAPRALHELRALGIRRIFMVTGDHPDVAELVGDATGVDRVFAERTPDEKVAVVEQVRADGPTLMVGDGVNDAPALALADVGVAMGGHATAASEAADVVLANDRLDSLVLAVRIAQRTRRIALQSVLVGMGLSVIAMGAAAMGWIAPVAGAVLQEGIDALVILNALRALGGPAVETRAIPGAAPLAEHLASAHRALRPRVEGLASLAAELDALEPAEARGRLQEATAMLETTLLPHEEEEQRVAYPVLAAASDADPTGPLVRTHQEIRRLARLFARLVARLPPSGPDAADLRDLRRALYGLHAVLSLHFAQEDELYSQLDRP